MHLFALELQLFWLSFIVIGAAALGLYRRVRQKDWQTISEFLGSMGFVVRALIYFSIGIACFVPVVVVGYIAKLPLAILALIYLIVLILSIISISRNWRQLISNLRRHLANYGREQWLRLVIVSLVLAVDVWYALHTGGRIDNDTPVHLGKIQLYLNSGHLSFEDPYVGYNGGFDLRYSANLLFGLQAIAGYLFRQSALEIWFYSFACYRLLMWAGFYLLCRAFLPEWLSRRWAWFIVILSILTYRDYFLVYAELPHCIVLVWVGILLVGLQQLFQRRSPSLFLLAALLIAETHAVTSAITIVFLCLYGGCLLIVRRLPLRTAGYLIGAVLLLAIPVIVNASVPVRSTGQVVNQDVRGGGLHTVNLVVHKAGPLVVPSLSQFLRLHGGDSVFNWMTLGVGSGVIVYLLFLRRLRPSKLKQAIVLLLILVAVAVYDTYYMSLFGTIVMLWYMRSLEERVLLGLVMLFYALTAYNPVFLTVLYGHVPLWTIARFQDFNPVSYITPLVGVVCLCTFAARYWGYERLANGYVLGGLIVLVGFFSHSTFPVRAVQILPLYAQAQTQSLNELQKAERLKPLDRYLKDQVVFTNDPTILDYMPAVTKGTRLGTIANEKANQANNISARFSCQRALFGSLRLADLQAAGVTRVVLMPGNNDGLDYAKDYIPVKPADEPYAVASKLPYLHYETQLGQDRVYSVRSTHGSSNLYSSVCSFPHGQ